MDEISGKVVIITGAGTGIGAATARLLGERGAKLVLAARRIERLEEVASEIRSAGGAAEVAAADVSRRDDMDALVVRACETYGRLDVLVSNAGIAPNSLFDDLKVDDWNAMIDINLRGALYGIAAALPVFRSQRSGHFVNIISTAGLVIKPTMGVYAATKNAVRTISEALRQEAGPSLRVTGISPGFVKTEFASSINDLNVRSAIKKRMDEIAIPASAVARCVAFAIEQPPEVDVGEIVIRPTNQD